MKYLIIGTFILFISVANLFGGVVEKTPYDQKWDITVINCQGQTIIYYDCVITNQGEYVITFMPNAGNIPTGNGRTVKIFQNNCTQVIMEQQ